MPEPRRRIDLIRERHKLMRAKMDAELRADDDDRAVGGEPCPADTSTKTDTVAAPIEPPVTTEKTEPLCVAPVAVPSAEPLTVSA